jgi:hypothetical protein
MSNLLTRLLSSIPDRKSGPYDNADKNRIAFLEGRQVSTIAKLMKLRDNGEQAKKLLSDVIDWCEVERKFNVSRGYYYAGDEWRRRGLRAIDIRNDLVDALVECRP